MHIVVFISAPNKKEAKFIAKQLIKLRLASCVNIIDKVESVFWWQGKVDRASEVLMIVKSKKERLAKIVKKVKSLHSYQVPEIIALPITGGFKPYLNWIDESLRNPS